MKTTRKIIIGVIALLALLITIAGAMAAPSATYSPLSNSVTVNQTQQIPFSVTVTNPEMMNLSYQWLVDGIPTGTTVENSGDYTSSFTFDATNKSVGNHIVSVVINGATPDLSHAWTVTVQDLQPASLLTISNIKINGKSSGKLKPGEMNKIEIEVSNDYTKKIEGISVTADLLDEDNDSIVDADDEISKIVAGDSDSITLELDLTHEDLDQDSYTLNVEVEGEATDSTKHTDSETKTVDVDREKDDLIITKADLEDRQVVCSATAKDTLKVRIKNVGEDNQNNAKIMVKNSELNLNQQKTGIDLDDYSGSDNEYDATFNLNLEDAKQGTYQLEVSVYTEDDDLMDSKEVELQVQCESATGTSSTENGTTEHYADKELAAELQRQLDQYKVMQEQVQSAHQESFRNSDSYVLLLGVLVAMLFFAAALSATYLMVKKK